MQKRLKSYLLFMFGKWEAIENHKPIVDNIKDVIESVVDPKEEFTFITGQHIIIMCLKSRMSFIELQDMLHEFLTPHIDTFFMMPKPRNLAYRLDGNLEGHLFGKKAKKRLKYIHPKVAEELSKHLQSLVELRVRDIKENLSAQKPLKEVLSKLKPMTLDSLLDKIIDEGLESLTKEEKEFLNTYNQ